MRDMGGKTMRDASGCGVNFEEFGTAAPWSCALWSL